MIGTSQTEHLSSLRACLVGQDETVVLFLVRRDYAKGDIAGQKTGTILLPNIEMHELTDGKKRLVDKNGVAAASDSSQRACSLSQAGASRAQRAR
uniref:Uncharacterized protein n=1 Tax=Thermogemmatispora argillosa TaxID=2045280 RepID=A0A455SYC8_9CHLR|nr:hypothetical protein KTA_08890 [Thermogemmatispora argillosa]